MRLIPSGSDLLLRADSDTSLLPCAAGVFTVAHGEFVPAPCVAPRLTRLNDGPSLFAPHTNGVPQQGYNATYGHVSSWLIRTCRFTDHRSTSLFPRAPRPRRRRNFLGVGISPLRFVRQSCRPARICVMMALARKGR